MPLNLRLIMKLSDTSTPGVISGTTTERIYPHDTLLLADREYRVCEMRRENEQLTHFLAIFPANKLLPTYEHKTTNNPRT